MVNLLGLNPRATASAFFDPTVRAELEARLRTLARLVRLGRSDCVARSFEELATELEELETSPSRVAAQALLDRIDAIRLATLARAPSDLHPPPPAPPPSDRSDLFVCHRPGRSLATGEAEVASRGYYDVRDRPPLDAWIGVLSTPALRGPEADCWIVAWVGPSDAARARAGLRACPTGALALLEDVAPAAARAPSIRVPAELLAAREATA